MMFLSSHLRLQLQKNYLFTMTGLLVGMGIGNGIGMGPESHKHPPPYPSPSRAIKATKTKGSQERELDLLPSIIRGGIGYGKLKLESPPAAETAASDAGKVLMIVIIGAGITGGGTFISKLIGMGKLLAIADGKRPELSHRILQGVGSKDTVSFKYDGDILIGVIGGQSTEFTTCGNTALKPFGGILQDWGCIIGEGKAWIDPTSVVKEQGPEFTVGWGTKEDCIPGRIFGTKVAGAIGI